MTIADRPFEFVTASYLTRIDNQQASTLTELGGALDLASDASIFHHTFQSLGRHHFLTEGFANDFAQWVLAGLNRPELAERLAALDIRDYVALSVLRNDLRTLVTHYCEGHPREAALTAFEPFYFAESLEVTVPLGVSAATLSEFRERLARLSHAAFHFHFISSRLRLHLATNDFSRWFSIELGLDSLARNANRIDIYTNTLDGAREELLDLIDAEMRQ